MKFFQYIANFSYISSDETIDRDHYCKLNYIIFIVLGVLKFKSGLQNFIRDIEKFLVEMDKILHIITVLGFLKDLKITVRSNQNLG